MTPKEIEKLFNHPAELSAKTDGKGNRRSRFAEKWLIWGGW